MGCEACQLCQLTTGVSVKFRKCHSCYWFRNRANQSLSRIQNIHGYPIFKRSIHLRWCKTSSTRRRFWATKSSSVSAGSLFCPPSNPLWPICLPSVEWFSLALRETAKWMEKHMPYHEEKLCLLTMASQIHFRWKRRGIHERSPLKQIATFVKVGVLTCFCKSSYKKNVRGFQWL